MKLYAKICCAALILIGLAGCATDDKYPAPEASTAAVRLKLSAGVWQTRAFTNTHNVDRIQVIPFVKDGNDVETDKNYIPAYSQAIQMDLGTDFAAFPIEDLTLTLAIGKTYKILILGYNSADYDHTNPTSASNKFGLTFDPTDNPPHAQSLWNFSLDLKQDGVQVTSCEVFSGLATTGGNEEFTVEEDVTLTVACTLKRISGGLSIGVTDIPANVTSMTLKCDQRVEGVWLARSGEASSISTLDDKPITSYTIATAAPSGGEVMIDTYLLNTVSSSTQVPTRFAIEVLFDDATTMVYPVRVLNPATSVTTDQIQIVSNQALNVSGSFSNFVFLINIGSAIDLDDNLWNGYNDPAVEYN